MKTENRLNKFIKEGRLIRGTWTGEDEEGRQTACLLAALSPEVAEKKDSNYCPAYIMPQWLAHLTPSIDDNGTSKQWLKMVKRYAKLASKWNVLTPEAWSRIEFKIKKISLLEAMNNTKYEPVLKVCNEVLSLLDRAISGDMPSKEEFAKARSAAYSAANSADNSAAYSAADSAADSADSAADSARSAANSAAYSARSAAISADSAANSAYSAANSAYSAAWDRLTEGFLDAIEEEIKAAK